MTRFELDIDPLHITADAIGQPGQRVFYLQGWQETDPKPVTVIIEKFQLEKLAIELEQKLHDIARDNPELVVPEVDYVPDKMRIHPPVDPLFRVGTMGLGYETGRDRIALVLDEMLPEDTNPGEASRVCFRCTRNQARQLSAWAEEVIERGRPICPQCGAPMEPEGHFCPKKNGNKKK
jgi:uncharacterized repeat protein (TIGR03847 family)